jgi:hypothetical protein
MPADTALAQLRRHDPARSLPAMSSEERESLRLRIVSSPVALRPRRRRLVVAAVAAAVGALVLAGVGLPLYEGVFSTPAQVRDDFAVWTKRVPLPPGAHWSPLNLGEDGLYGGKSAQLIATDQATCAWFAYWRDALAAHDQARLTAAEAGIEKVRGLLPIHPAGAREDAGGNTAQSLRVYDEILRQQQGGNAIGTEQYLLANC